MKFFCLFALCAISCSQLAVAEPESKFDEIVKLLNQREHLQGAAQTYSASLADPSGYAGSARSSERSRAAPSKYDQEGDDAKKVAEEEEEKKPDRLAILLAESKFTCENLKNGYYADESVGCQVFHYCVDGVKHSWQCPENTVFHQIHLNCVPNTQDICAQSSKFHVVNDYLHKELDERGPNNTVQYHQRFYPEGFEIGGGDTVTQIFRAQAQAHALAKAQRQRDPESYEEQPEPVRPRPQSRPKQQQFVPAQAARPVNSGRAVYKPQSRPLLVSPNYSAGSQPLPTKRPNAYTTPETNYNPPTYTESTDEDYSSNDYPSPSSSSPSASSGPSAPSSSFSVPSSNNHGGSVNFHAGSVSNSFSPSSGSSSTSSSGFRGHQQQGGSSRPSSYPTRSLGIPIASFRVAPSQAYTPQASSIQIVPVSMFDSQPLSRYQY